MMRIARSVTTRAPVNAVNAVTTKVATIVIALVVAIAASTAAAPAFAAEIVVTNSTDDPGAPKAGSLRAALAAAGPGDVVRFDQFRIVALEGPLEISPSKTGLTLRGPGQIMPRSASAETPLVVQANSVRIEALTVRDTEIRAEVVSGLRVTGSLMSGKRARIFLANTLGAVVGTIAAPNDFVGCSKGITLETTTSTTIEGNTFSGCKFAIDDEGSSALAIRDNVADGVVSASAVSGTITRNTITAKSLAGIFIDETADPGLLTISANTIHISGGADGIDVRGRGGVVITGNLIDGKNKRTGIKVVDIDEATDFSGAIAVAGNVVRNVMVGILVAPTRSPGPDISVSMNDVREIRDTGIGVIAYGPGTLTCNGNVLENVGAGKTDSGIFLASRGATASAASNSVTGARGSGIVIGNDSTRITLTGNTVDGAKSHGIAANVGATVAISGCTIRGAGGSGVFAGVGAHLSLDGTVFSATKGPEVDLAPRGATSNERAKTANDDLDFPEAFIAIGTGDVRGTTVANGRVTLFGPGAGGDLAPLADFTADGTGAFTIPKASLPVGDVRILVHTPDDADVSELSPPVPDEPPPPDEPVVEGGPNGTFAEVEFLDGTPVAGQTGRVVIITQNPGPSLGTGVLHVTGKGLKFDFTNVVIPMGDPERPEFPEATTVIPVKFPKGGITITGKLGSLLLWRVTIPVAGN